MRRTKTVDPAGYIRIGAVAALLASPLAASGQSTMDPSPEAVVNRQVAAYNRHDLDGFLDTYSDKASFYTLGSSRIAHSKAMLHEMVGSMYTKYPNLQSKTVARVGFGPFVVDREQISGIPDAPDLAILSVYEVRYGRIVSYWQSPVAPPKDNDPVLPEPDPSARTTVDQLRTAFNKHDLDKAVAVFADTVSHYALTRDTVAEPLTRDEMRERLNHLFDHGRHPHVVARAQLAVGPYVVARETVDGLSADQPAGDLMIAQVENGKIIALWDAS